MAFITIIVAVAASLSAIAKLTKNPKVVHSVHEVCRVPMEKLPLLAALELAGSAGAVIGLWVGWIGVAATIGLTLYFAGAVAAHLRVGDKAGVAPAAGLMVLSVVALLLR